MSLKRMVGVALIVIGIVALVWGGVFWNDTDTVFEAGPLEVESTQREGIALPPVLGIISLIGGIILVALPNRART